MRNLYNLSKPVESDRFTTPEEIFVEIFRYLEWANLCGRALSIYGVCAFLGVSINTWNLWKGGHLPRKNSKESHFVRKHIISWTELIISEDNFSYECEGINRKIPKVAIFEKTKLKFGERGYIEQDYGSPERDIRMYFDWAEDRALSVQGAMLFMGMDKHGWNIQLEKIRSWAENIIIENNFAMARDGLYDANVVGRQIKEIDQNPTSYDKWLKSKKDKEEIYD